MRTWDQLRDEVLREDTAGAAAYIRLALKENNQRELFQAVRNVFAARGTLKGLGLTKAELATLTDAVLSGLPAPRTRKNVHRTVVSRALA